MSNGNYTRCWHAKGLTGNMRRAPWSAVVNDSIVITCWNNKRDIEDSEWRYIDGQDVMRCGPGDGWAYKPKGKRFIQHARESMAGGKLAEVIMIEGRRWPSPSSVRNAYIDHSKYYIRFTRVDDDGVVEGVFVPKVAA